MLWKTSEHVQSRKPMKCAIRLGLTGPRLHAVCCCVFSPKVTSCGCAKDRYATTARARGLPVMPPPDIRRRYSRLKQMIGDEGGYLTSSGGLVEERLEAAPRTEKRRARSDSLALAIRPEPVRRMTRRAGISSYATSAPANEDIVIKTLSQIEDVVLFNLIEEISRLCEYLRRRTVTEDIVREAVKRLRGDAARVL